MSMITVTNTSEQKYANIPIQIGRAFREGHIPDFPTIGNYSIPVQADVKNRWPDGSVKFAIMSFVLPELKAKEATDIQFTNTSMYEQSGYFNPNTDLAEIKYLKNLNATMVFDPAGAYKHTTRVVEMLKNGTYTYWTKGPVSTTLIIADHEYAQDDAGPSGAYRPIFHLTIWKDINSVDIRFIGEIASTGYMRDVEHVTAVRTNYEDYTVEEYCSEKLNLMSSGWVNQIAGSRWTKKISVMEQNGVAVPFAHNIEIDHRLDHLKGTKVFPNYDLNKIPSEGAIHKLYSKFVNSDNTPTAQGLWTKAMGTGGGRHEIGPYPSWAVLWLYTGDNRMRDVTLKQAELAAAWPMHLREADKTKSYLRTDWPGSGTGVGLPISVTERRTILMWHGIKADKYHYTDPNDYINKAGECTSEAWNEDGAHQPAPFFIPYAFTGDYFFLEEMLFWASFSVARYNYGCFYGRGPTGAEGALRDETRGNAWVFKNRCEAATMAPDGSPEKEYFTTLIEDCIASWDGVKDLKDSKYKEHFMYQWGKSNIDEEYGWYLEPETGIEKYHGIPPLHTWSSGGYGEGANAPPVDPEVTLTSCSPWQEYMLLFALGRAKELGFKTDAILKWYSVYPIMQLIHPGFNPYYTIAYRGPVMGLEAFHYFQTPEEMLDGFDPDYDIKGKFWSYMKDAEHGYCFILLCAMAYVSDEIGGEQAWNKIKKKVLNAPVLSDNPKWAIIPRI